jgi:dsDNA-specific endonuclease/ATPase MutS2
MKRRAIKLFASAVDAYSAGYGARTAAHIRRGFAKARPSHELALGFAQGANAFFVAERYGIDLSLPRPANAKAVKQ